MITEALDIACIRWMRNDREKNSGSQKPWKEENKLAREQKNINIRDK